MAFVIFCFIHSFKVFCYETWKMYTFASLMKYLYVLWVNLWYKEIAYGLDHQTENLT